MDSVREKEGEEEQGKQREGKRTSREREGKQGIQGEQDRQTDRDRVRGQQGRQRK